MTRPDRQGPEAGPWEGTAEPFRAPWWARGPHLQTLLARILRPADDTPYRRERWDTPDGDFLDVDFGPDPDPDAPVVLILHGLEGSSKRRYVRSVARELVDRGCHPVALNFRACGGTPNRTPRFYHSGATDDLGFILDRLAERYPTRPLGAVGFSLGGNVLLKYLGEEPDGVPDTFGAAAAISVPLDLAAGERFLNHTWMGRRYTAYFLRSLRRKIRAKAGLLAGHVDVPSVLSARTLREFDDRATAPLHGFRDADDYYATASSGRYLSGIRVPTLLLQARDDPFLPSHALPEAALRENPWIHARITARGGHVGFVTGSPRRPVFWAERQAAAFLRAIPTGATETTPPAPPGASGNHA